MIKYQIWIGTVSTDIDRVEFERETEFYYYQKNGRKVAKDGTRKYYNTWDEAKAGLIFIAENKVKEVRNRLGYYETLLSQIQDLKGE